GEHRGAEGGPTRVLEHGVDITADEATDVLAEAAPLLLVLGVFVLPELVAGLAAVDDVLTAPRPAQLGPLGGGHDAHRGTAAVEDVLNRVATDAAGRSPDEDGLALPEVSGVGADDHAVGGGVAQRVAGRLFPAEVRGLGH